MKKLQEIQVDDVLKAYEGKPGCMCGCNGSYFVTPECRAEADAERGYAYEDGDVSRESVQRILRLVQSAGASAGADVGLWFASVGGKELCVYLRASVEGAPDGGVGT